MSKSRYAVLLGVVILSLLLNVFLVLQWFRFRQQMLLLQGTTQAALSQTIADLDSMQQSQVTIGVRLTQNVPVSTTLPFRQTWEVPISTTIPIHQNVRTTVSVNIPGLGVTVPVNVAVPLALEVPVRLRVPVNIDQSVPISTTVPIDVHTPVSVDLSNTGLAAYLARLRSSLVSLRAAVGQAGR